MTTTPKKARELEGHCPYCFVSPGTPHDKKCVMLLDIYQLRDKVEAYTYKSPPTRPTDVTLPRAVVEQVLDQMNYMHPGTEITRALESALKSHSQEGQG